MRWLPVVAAIAIIIASVAVSEPVAGGGSASTTKRGVALDAAALGRSGDTEPRVVLAEPPFWKTCRTGRACARAVIRRVFRGDISREMAIVSCETGGTYNARAMGSAGERGWWQIHPVHFGWVDEERLWNPRYNTRIAYRLSEGGTDFSPWSCA